MSDYLIDEELGVFGGTSAAARLWSGVLGLMVQSRKHSRYLIRAIYHSTYSSVHNNTAPPCPTYSTLLSNHTNSIPVEKIYVSHDKPVYVLGDTLWCNAFMVEGHTLLPFDAQPLIKAQWVDPQGKLLQEVDLKVDSGMAPFEIATFDDDPPGEYTLRVFSLYQLNFDPHFIFQQKFTLGDPLPSEPAEKELQLEFFPEGGQLVAGLSSRIGMALRDQNQGVPGTVQILDAAGNTLDTLTTGTNGLGYFEFMPDNNQQLTALVVLEGDTLRQELPIIETGGQSLSVSSGDGVQIVCKVNATSSLQGFTLVAHMRGEVFLEYDCPDSQTLTLRLAKAELPNGLIHFTLFNPRLQPRCERIIANLAGEISPSLQVATSRMEDRLTVDLAQLPTGSQTTISIFQSLYSEAAPAQDIRSYLWLQSDLPESLEMKGLDRLSAKDLDDLLLIHGWSRFSWEALVEQESISVRFPQRETYTLAGKTTSKRTGQPVAADVTCTIFRDSTMQIVKSPSSPEGLFLFENLDFTDSTEILLHANPIPVEGKKKIRDEIVIKQLDVSGEELMDSVVVWPKVFASENPRLLDEPLNDPSIWRVDLDEVTVRARQSRAQLREAKVKKRYREKGFFYLPSTDKFILADDFSTNKYANMYGLISTVFPRAKVIREQGNTKIIYGRLSSGTVANVVVDGFQRSPDYLLNIDPYSIEIAEYIDDLKAAALGYGSEQVLFFTTKDATDPISSSSLGVSYPGYYQSQKFTADLPCLQNGVAPGERTTLLWQVTERRDSLTSLVSCLPSSGYDCYIRIEGITQEGIPFAHFAKFRSEY